MPQLIEIKCRISELEESINQQKIDGSEDWIDTQELAFLKREENELKSMLDESKGFLQTLKSYFRMRSPVKYDY